MQERENGSKFMKTPQKQTVRHNNLRKFPKFSIPPEVLVLREVELLGMSQRFEQRCRQEQLLPQHRRD
jgi:hypothetical protein